MILAIIPARGGSKRIPKKNIKSFLGQPIINYSIVAAIQSGVFDKVIVSTDSEEIKSFAIKGGADVPFMRPKSLATDASSTAVVLSHAVKWFQNHGHKVEHFCCIYPTAPLLSANSIRDGYNLITSENVASVFSVTTFPYPIQRALKLNRSGSLEMFWPEHENSLSNYLEESYHDAGQFYWLNTDQFLITGKLFSTDALPIILPRYLVQDIDTPEDWETAERQFMALQSHRREL